MATISLKANMPRQVRENCLTIFTDLLARYKEDIHAATFPQLLQELKTSTKASQAEISMYFPYFINKKAPVSSTTSLMEYQCGFIGNTKKKRNFLIQVVVPLTTLCPCSKEISSFGAHNQRAEVILTLEATRFIWLEDIITMVEKCGSCEVYTLLKRPDEKFVTEEAYNNPMFVEDVVRKVAQQAGNHPDISWFSVSVESFESIHKHSAYAFVDSDDL